MPQKKKKNQSDSDTSDSGPDDVAPPSKKSKPEAKTSKKKETSDDEEPTWALDRNRSLKLREFRGKLLVDIREYYEKDGELRPGKKGISLSAQQWRKLVDSVPEIDEAIKKMV